MKILDRYIAQTVIASILLVLLVLVSLDSFVRLVRELDEVGVGDYTQTEMLIYLALTTPYRVVQFFPITALLGAIVGLGVLASNSELVVLRSSGVSIFRISLAVLKTGLLFIIAIMITSEFVVPFSEKYAESRRSLKLAEQTALQTKNGFWSRDAGSYLNIREVSPRGDLGDIYIYEFDENHQLRNTTHAEKAVYEDGQWLLQGITQSQVDTSGITTRQLSGAQWDSLLNPGLVNIVVTDPLRLSIFDLYNYYHYLKDNGQDAGRYELAFWVRVFSPLSIAVMFLLAVPFVFGPLRSVGIGQRIMVGFLVGLGFFLFNQTFNHLGTVYSLSPVMSASLPTGVFFIVTLILMRKRV